MKPLASMEIDASSLDVLGRLLKAESDGKALRKDLAKQIRNALAPARDVARSGILSMHSGGLGHDGEPLRQAIARRIVVEARLSGRATGARIRAKRKGLPRNFELAAKRTNSGAGWRRPAGDNWVVQVGKPRWFDDAIETDQTVYREAVIAAMQESFNRIKHRLPRA